jgi:hypothetical protein
VSILVVFQRKRGSVSVQSGLTKNFKGYLKLKDNF